MVPLCALHRRRYLRDLLRVELELGLVQGMSRAICTLIRQYQARSCTFIWHFQARGVGAQEEGVVGRSAQTVCATWRISTMLSFCSLISISMANDVALTCIAKLQVQRSGNVAMTGILLTASLACGDRPLVASRNRHRCLYFE